jgi:hypothetical protein
MARRKNVELQAETITFQVPTGSDLTSRIEKISVQTGLDTSALFQKWVLQEESLIGLMQRSKGHIAEQDKTNSPQDVSDIQKEKTAEINPDSPDYRKMLVKRIENLKKEGMTFVKIAHLFNEENLQTVSGKGKWYSSSIINLLKSKV